MSYKLTIVANGGIVSEFIRTRRASLPVGQAGLYCASRRGLTSDIFLETNHEYATNEET